MKWRFLHIIFLVTTCFTASSQQLNTVRFYLQHTEISEDAIEFYTGRSTVKNQEKALAVVDSMFTENNETRPFYLLLVSRMSLVAKGALNKQITMSCRHFAEQHPSDLAAFLYQKHLLMDSRFVDEWAHKISVDIRVMCDEDLLSCFKQSRNIALANCNEDYKPKIEVLYNSVRQRLNLFQQR